MHAVDGTAGTHPSAQSRQGPPRRPSPRPAAPLLVPPPPPRPVVAAAVLLLLLLLLLLLPPPPLAPPARARSRPAAARGAAGGAAAPTAGAAMAVFSCRRGPSFAVAACCWGRAFLVLITARRPGPASSRNPPACLPRPACAQGIGVGCGRSIDESNADILVGDSVHRWIEINCGRRESTVVGMHIISSSRSPYDVLRLLLCGAAWANMDGPCDAALYIRPPLDGSLPNRSKAQGWLCGTTGAPR